MKMKTSTKLGRHSLISLKGPKLGMSVDMTLEILFYALTQATLEYVNICARYYATQSSHDPC